MGLCSVVMHPDLLALADVVQVVDEHTFIVAGYESSVDPIGPAAAPDRAEHILDPDPAPVARADRGIVACDPDLPALLCASIGT